MRIAVGIECIALDELLADAAAAAFGEHRDARADFGARREVRTDLAGLLDAHVTDLHAGDRPVLVEKGHCRGEPREHVDAEGFGALRQHRRQQAERDDEIALVVLLWRCRQADPPGSRQQRELITLGGDADAGRRVAPAGQQRIERARFEHGTGEGLRTDCRGFFEHAHREVRFALLERNGAGQARGATAHHQHVVFHHVAFDRLCHGLVVR